MCGIEPGEHACCGNHTCAVQPVAYDFVTNGTAMVVVMSGEFFTKLLPSLPSTEKILAAGNLKLIARWKHL